MTPEEIAALTGPEAEALLYRATQSHLAHFLVLSIGLAARNHPDELRKALASVFDVKALEEHAETIRGKFEQLLQQRDNWPQRVATLERELADERRLRAAQDERVQALEEALDKLRKLWKQKFTNNGRQA
jgi:hypothetical protein